MNIKNAVLTILAVSLFSAVSYYSCSLALAEDLLPTQPTDTPINYAYQDEIEDLIKNQLGAIRERDAERAFSTLSDGMHGKFNDAKKFLAKMRFEYGAIYNHETYTFLESHSTDNGDIIQKVKMQDRYSGESSLVIYRMGEDLEGHWVIESFTVINLDSIPI